MRCATGVAGWTLNGIRRRGGLTLVGGAVAGEGVTLFIVASCGGGTPSGGDATLGGGAGVGGGYTLGGGITHGGGTTLGADRGSGGRCGKGLGAPNKGRCVARGGGKGCVLHLMKSSLSLLIAVSCSLWSVAEVYFTAE